jgi:AraC-like DNA-binding protein
MQQSANVADSSGSVRVRRVCTDDWPERDRVAMFSDNVGRDRVRVEPLPDDPFRIEGIFIRMPGLGLVTVSRSSLRSDFADGNDRLMINLGGEAAATQFGREHELQVGDAIALSGSDLGSFTTLQNGRLATLEFSKGTLLPRLRDPASNCGQRIPNGSPALRLLRLYLKSLRANGSFAVPGLQQLAVAHIHDLAAFALGPNREAEQIASGRGVRAARLQAIKNDILANLSGDLSPPDIAARHQLSARYVRMLFEGEETSFSEFVRDERLKRARRMLINAAFDHRLISEIAYEVGFNDLSYFNRSFRRRFGGSPGEIRELSRRAV